MEVININNIKWTIVASIAAAVSAFASLISIIISYHWNRKTYKANVEIEPKLEALYTLRKLIPDYIAEINYVTYLYCKAAANQNDERRAKENILPDGVIWGNITFEDHDRQMAKTKLVHEHLTAILRLEGAALLLKDAQELWNCLSLRKEYYKEVTNEFVSKKEKEFNHLLNETSDKLNNDFIEYYKSKIELYEKGKSA